MISTGALLLVLAALFLGALIPVFIQLAMTLAALRTLLAGMAPRLARTLDDVTAASASAKHVFSGLDPEKAAEVADGLAEIGKLAKRLREIGGTVEIAAAMGAAAAPAVTAAVRAMREPAPPEEAPHDEVEAHSQEVS